MGLFNREYDRDYGTRGGMWRGGDYDRTFRGRGGAFGGGMTGAWGTGHRGYDRDLGYRQTGYRGGASRYDQPYWGYDTWDYDLEYKSRAQTDYGDPFGDRQANTPIRVVEDRDRGWFGRRGRYDREFRGYEGDFMRSERRPGPGAGYDPYYTRGGDMSRLRRRTRGYDRNYRRKDGPAAKTPVKGAMEAEAANR
jgi:hypothetical protein